jgi:S1-C subfamily serine protease
MDRFHRENTEKREHTIMQKTERNDVDTSMYQPPQGPTLPPTQPRHTSRGLRTGAIALLTLVLTLVFGTGLFAGWQFGTSGGIGGNTTGATPSPASTSNVETLREAVIARVRPAVVQVNVTTQQGQGLGSGVIIDQRGYIITNNHVVNGASQIQVMLFDGVILPAQVTGISSPDDLAVLKVTPPKNGLTVATLGDSSQLRVGQEVLAIGNPLGITQTVTSGIVSALDRTVGTIPGAIQTDAPINPGNSGGALVDLQGSLIGIPTSTAIDPQFRTPANGVGFAIPSNRVQFIAPQIIETGSVTNSGRAALGVSVTSVDPTLATQNNLSTNHGALITAVTTGGAAAQAGLRSGDVIVRIENKDVNDVSSLTDALVSKKPGDTVSVQVYRGNQQLTITVKLGELRLQ